MKRRIFTLLLAVGALIGVSSIASAQELEVLESVRGDKWKASWDSAMMGDKKGNWYLPHRPAGPGTKVSASTYTPVRLYQGVPVRIDTAFQIPGGKNRRYVFKNMPKDEQGRHYIVEAGTAKVYPEADTVRLPDSKEPTIIKMTIVHYALSPGDHDEAHYDGYVSEIHLEVHMTQRWDPTTSAYVDVSGGFYTDGIRYQYFKLPGVTADSRYRKPAPKDSGIFEVYWDGALMNPTRRVGGYPHGMSGTDGEYVYAAYYSLDNGATWLGVEPYSGGFKLNKQQIAGLPEDGFQLLVKLPGNVKPYPVMNVAGIVAPYDPTVDPNGPTPVPPTPAPEYTRQIIVQNSTDAVVEPYKQIYDVPSGKDFDFKLRVPAGKKPIVTTSRNKTTPDDLGVKVDLVPGSDTLYTVKIRKVREELTVTIAYDKTANVEAAATRVWGENGQLYIMSAAAGRANVYNVLGKLNRSVTLSAGETKSVSVPAGIYVVSMNNGKAYKVAVR